MSIIITFFLALFIALFVAFSSSTGHQDRHNNGKRSIERTSSSSKTSSATNFLSLPPELRNQKYELVLVERKTITYPLDCDDNKGIQMHVSGLLSTNKQVRSETLPIYYGRNSFLSYGRNELYAFLRYLGPEARQSLTCIQVTFLPQSDWFESKKCKMANFILPLRYFHGTPNVSETPDEEQERSEMSKKNWERALAAQKELADAGMGLQDEVLQFFTVCLEPNHDFDDPIPTPNLRQMNSHISSDTLESTIATAAGPDLLGYEGSPRKGNFDFSGWGSWDDQAEVEDRLQWVENGEMPEWWLDVLKVEDEE